MKKSLGETVNITTRKFLVSKSEDRGSLKTVKTESRVKDVGKFWIKINIFLVVPEYFSIFAGEYGKWVPKKHVFYIIIW